MIWWHILKLFYKYNNIFFSTVKQIICLYKIYCSIIWHQTASKVHSPYHTALLVPSFMKTKKEDKHSFLEKIFFLSKQLMNESLAALASRNVTEMN